MSKPAFHPIYHAHHAVALLFLSGIALSSQLLFSGIDNHGVMIIAAVLGGYMALNIGANDAGNNIGPLVGSAVIGLSGALLFAALFEAAGAFLAGDEVISTIKQGIVDPEQLGDSRTIIRVMFSAMLAGAVWLNIATATGTPVSTTHTIVGGVLGAGITVGGIGVADWEMIGAITVSWLISPLLSGIIAALLLYLIKRTITYQAKMSASAGKAVPLLVGLMAWTFTSYLLIKGVKASWRVDLPTALVCGMSIGLGVYLIIKPNIVQRTAMLPNTKSAVNRLFNLPLLLAAGLLSFAHGSNDVANAIGPLIAIKEAATVSGDPPLPDLPAWLLMIGAMGIPLGLVLYGKRLIKTIGSEITELDQVRAFCIVTSVTITVLLASRFGLPVSSTHTAVGAVFGIGFLRESLKTRYAILLEMLRRRQAGQDRQVMEQFIKRFDRSSFHEKGRMLEQLNATDNRLELSNKERKSLNKLYRRELVKRSAFTRILLTWVITLPATGALAALIYHLLESTVIYNFLFNTGG
ncbi:MAG: inorganic phosphate transporter [Candidatus Thiodiazotropha sp. (ex Dulcina madagascariensis)]|nr:inorganic phosphate transporter [Candidatus Thiodiazotropha sp. (ex Dulcina madagascariensis)]